jgi:hypothetical protein
VTLEVGRSLARTHTRGIVSRKPMDNASEALSSLRSATEICAFDARNLLPLNRRAQKAGVPIIDVNIPANFKLFSKPYPAVPGERDEKGGQNE